MTLDQATELERLRVSAKRIEYYENPMMGEKDIVMFMVRILPETRCLSLPEILKQDLSLYPVFSSVVFWCNSQNGIGKDYPEDVIRVSHALFERFHPEVLLQKR